MSLSHRAGQHRQRSSRDPGPCCDIGRCVMETRRRGNHRGEGRRSDHDRDVDAVFRVRPRRLRAWRRGSGQPHLSVKVTIANTQRWLAGGGWRGDQPRHRRDPRVAGCRHDLAAEGDVSREDTGRPAAYAPGARRRGDPDDVGVTGDRFGRGEVREKRLGCLEQIVTDGLSGGRRGCLVHKRQYRVGLR